MVQYAALDVEYLLELRDALDRDLDAAGKAVIAEQEFARVAVFQPRSPGPDPWRRTSGLHRARKPRQLAVVRELWWARDDIARSTDIAPGRILPDSAILAAAAADVSSAQGLLEVEGFHGRGAARYVDRWWQALQRAHVLPADQLPIGAAPTPGPPAPRTWEERNPEAHHRLQQAKEILSRTSQSMAIPVENLLAPDLVRQICWDGPTDIGAAMRAGGARPWQVDLLAHPIHDAWHDIPKEPE